jgi:putative membrane protein
LPWALAGLAVACQIGYPLTGGQDRTVLTVVTVMVFCLATVAAVTLRYGPGRALGYAAVTAGGGLLVEAVGVHTGWPFGRYAYADSLGWKLLGVPVVVPLAWAMMAYPALVAGRRVAAGWAGGRVATRPGTRPEPPVRWAVPLVAGWGLASWDVFLDPQMVAAGHWRWADPSPALPGVPGIPLTNYGGWLVVGVVMAAALGRVLAPRATPGAAADAQPAMLYLWTYLSSVLANVAFFDRPGVAVAGGLAMGVAAVPLAAALRPAARWSRPVRPVP